MIFMIFVAIFEFFHHFGAKLVIFGPPDRAGAWEILGAPSQNFQNVLALRLFGVSWANG